MTTSVPARTRKGASPTRKGAPKQGRQNPAPRGRAAEHPATRTIQSPAVWALIGIVAIVFARTLGQGFSPWDDSIAVYANPYLDPVTPANIAHFWTQPYQGLYIPLAYTIFSALALLGHSAAVDPATGSHFQAAPFHLANIALHCGNVVLVYMILRTLVGRDVPTALGAFLFGLHPLQVESVAWIPELRGLSSAFFLLLAIWWYISYARATREGRDARYRYTRYALAVLAGVLAMLCKPTAVSLPLILFALDRWLIARPTLRCLRSSALFVVPGALIVLLTHAAQPVAASVTPPLLQRPFVAGDALAFYIVKLIAPFQLAIVYGRTPSAVLQAWWGHLTWLLPAGLAVALWVKRAAYPWLLAAGTVSFAALLPNLGLAPFVFQYYSTVADRYAYLALLGPALALAYLLARVPPRAAREVAMAVLACLALLCVIQQGYWDNSLTLWGHAVEVSGSDTAYVNYGLQQIDNGMRYAAMDSLRHAILLNPKNPDAYAELGTALLAVGRAPQAAAALRKSISLRPDNAEAHYKLGVAYAELGKQQDALTQFGAQIRLLPTGPARAKQQQALLKLLRALKPTPPASTGTGAHL